MLHWNKTHNLEDNPDNHGLELNRSLQDKYKEGVLLGFTKEKLLYKCRKMFHLSMFGINPGKINSRNLVNYNNILGIHNLEVLVP
jgi:hypothetical protein